MRTYYYSAFLLLGGLAYSLQGPTIPSPGTDGHAASADRRPTGKRADASAKAKKSSSRRRDADLISLLFDGPAGRGESGCVNRLRDDIRDPRFVIATLPDPLVTHLRVEFDRANDAIELAAHEDGYFFRRFWLPWRAEPMRQYDDYQSDENQDEDRKERRKLPGVLVFDNREHWSLIVFLVGESPTDGVNREQFRGALHLKCLIERHVRNDSGAERPVSILGTSFSGSLWSLRLALREAFEKNARLRVASIVSGTVTDPWTIDDFVKPTPPDSLQVPRLQTMGIDTNTALTELRAYAARNWGYNKPIAVLYETETFYGAMKGLSQDAGFLPIPFPRDIAHLRNAYQEYPELNGLDSNMETQRKNLPLRLDDTVAVGDSIPDFGAQTPVSQETTVLQIASQVRHKNIRFAVIVGTDVLDILFMSRFLRAAAPDTRLFLLDPDLLLVHAADALPFEGILAVTDFPLIEANPPFVPANKPVNLDPVFLGPFEEGIHNAMGFILSGRRTNRPLWITSVGRDSYVPIAELGANSSSEVSPPTRLWWALFVGATLTLMGFIFALYSAQMTPTGTWCADLRLAGGTLISGTNRNGQVCLLITATVGLYLALVSTPVGLLGAVPSPAQTAAAFVGLGTWILFLVVVWLLPVPAQQKMQVTLSLVLACGALLAVAFVSARPNAQGLFFAFRSFQFSSGASPLVPFFFLLLGAILIAYVSVERCIFHEDRRQLLPTAGGIPILENVATQAESLYGVLANPLLSGPKSRALVFLSSGVLVYAPLYLGGFRSLESRFYDQVFLVCVAGLGGGLFLFCSDFLRYWLRLSRVLQQMEMHPLREALEQLPPDHSWSPIWQKSPRRRNYVLSARSLECLQALSGYFGPTAAVPSYINQAINSVNVVLGEVAAGMRPTPDETNTAQIDLQTAADSLLPALNTLVWNKGGSEIVRRAVEFERTREAAKETPEDFKVRRPEILAAEFVALRYLAFIRYVMLQLRNLLTLLTFGFMAFSLALISYPFQAERLIAWEITVVFAALGSVVVFVLAETETDATLSRVTNTDAGKLGLEFFHRLLSYGTLPLLTVIATHFNGVGQLMFSWIQPALRSLH